LTSLDLLDANGQLAGITDTGSMGVLLVGVVHPRTVVTDITDPILVEIGLVRVVGEWTIVLAIDDTVPVTIRVGDNGGGPSRTVPAIIDDGGPTRNSCAIQR